MPKFMFVIISVILFINTACNKNEILLFEKAERYIDIDPDSVDHYLKLIEHPEKLPPSQRAKFGLMEAKKFPVDYKTELSINYSLDYYTKAKDTIMMIECYIAKCYYNQDSLPKTIKLLRVAEKLALEINNYKRTSYLYLNIGYSYEKQNDYNMALNSFLKAYEYAPQNDYSYILTHWDLARLYNKKGMKKEAIESLQNIIEKAKLYSPQTLSSTYKQFSDIYLDLKDFEKALEYINLSIQYRANIKEAPSYNLAKAIVFINTQELDSARLYLSYAIESPNPYVSNRGLGYLYELNNKINQYEKAYYARINEDNNSRSLLTMEEMGMLRQKYLEEKLKNENNQLILEKQQQQNYSLVITIILLIVFASTYAIYSYKQKQQVLMKHEHEEQLLKEKALLHKSQNLLLKRENELALLHQKAATLRASLFKKMSLFQKLPSLDKDDTKKNNNGKISLTEQDLVELKRTVDAAYNDFSKRLADSYSSLSDDDLIFCCLIKIQVDMQDLSDIYCISKAGITKRKMRIKKSKLKIQTQISLDDFIQHF